RDANAYVDIAFTTGMGFMRNTLTVRTADAVIMISGGIGTLNELTVSYQEKPTVILEGTGGWSDRIREISYAVSYLEQRADSQLRYANSHAQAVYVALELAATATGNTAEREFRS